MYAKKRLPLFLLLATLFYSANASAAWTGKATVMRYMPAFGTAVYLKMNATHINPAGCASTYYYAMVSNVQAEFDEYKKMILTAAASGKRLSVEVDNTACAGSYPRINRLVFEGS